MLGEHLLGLYEKALPPSMSWLERLTTARELGFDFVEISIDEADDRLARLDWNEEQKQELHDAIRQSGICLHSMCLSGHRRFPFGSADPELRAKAYEIMEKALLFAREFGIRVIQLAGYDVYYEPSTPESLRLYEEGMRWACRMAEKYQVMLAMEIMDTEFMSSITRYKKWKNLIPSPWFTVYPDLGNLSAWGNDTMAEIDLGRHEIVAVHIKDTIAVTPDFPGKFKCVPFGSGCVDFPACFKRLAQQDYAGPFMVEMWYDPALDWKKDITESKAMIENWFAEGTKGV